MQREWLTGFSAASALLMLIGINLALTLIANRGRRAALVLLRRVRRRR